MAFIESAWPRTKGIPSRAHRSASQVPGQDAFDADDQICPVGGNGFEKWFWASGHVAVEQHLSLLVQDTQVHAPGVQVDPTIKLVLLGVESHEVSSS
jgi:hypothetical protein